MSFFKEHLKSQIHLINFTTCYIIIVNYSQQKKKLNSQKTQNKSKCQ